MTDDETLARVRDMKYGEFTKFVNRDTRSNTAEVEAKALRDPSMRTKWRLVLAQLRREIDSQIEAKRAELASMLGEPGHDVREIEFERWLASTVRIRARLDERISECEFLTLSETTD